MPDEARLAEALGLALTGRRLALAAPDTLPADLGALGYPPTRLAELRSQRQAAESPWPFPVPIDELRAIGFARFDAALADARRALGLEGLTPSKPARRRLDRDELRLLEDCPPHW